MKYSDEKLISFLNGKLSEAEAKQIEAEMLADASFERRIMALDGTAETIRQEMKKLPTKSHIEDLQNTLGLTGTKSAQPKWWIGASIAAALVAGIFIGDFIKDPNDQSNNWRVEVARYQALYTPETIAHLDRSPIAIAEQFERASDAMGLSLQPDQLDQVDGLSLKRAQLLGFKDKPLLQIVYQDENGIPIAFCMLLKAHQNEPSNRQDMQLAGLASSSWENATHQFILIGGTDQFEISRLADEFQSLRF